jgi:hypothetical protein
VSSLWGYVYVGLFQVVLVLFVGRNFLMWRQLSFTIVVLAEDYGLDYIVDFVVVVVVGPI